MTEGKRTEYVVLRVYPGSGDVPLWEEAGHAHATSAKAAISQRVGEQSGTYCAIPVRSFQPVQVSVEQRATLSFGEPVSATAAQSLVEEQP